MKQQPQISSATELSQIDRPPTEHVEDGGLVSYPDSMSQDVAIAPEKTYKTHDFTIAPEKTYKTRDFTAFMLEAVGLM